MQIKKIELKNYRNYNNLELVFCDNLNIIIGDNAQGKTNLLESIYVLAVTKSFLSISDKSVINFDGDFAKVTGYLNKDNKVNVLDIIFNKNGKVVKSNGKEIKKLSDYITFMNVVIFSNNDIIVFKDSPVARRKYFNIQISQINRKYLRILSDYNLILRQKNEFLKIINCNKKSDIDYLNIINSKYADIASDIYRYRSDYVNGINKYLGDIFSAITGIVGLMLEYNSNIEINDDLEINLIDKINKNFSRELQYKMAIVGPNHDDFYFILNGKNLSLYGSQGQIRSAVLSLKLAEVKLFTDVVGDSPILLLDDIFSELDIGKRNSVLEYLNSNVQTVITTTDVENISEKIRKQANVYKIENGKVISSELILEQEGEENE